jgi:hypothetical protein
VPSHHYVLVVSGSVSSVKADEDLVLTSASEAISMQTHFNHHKASEVELPLLYFRSPLRIDLTVVAISNVFVRLRFTVHNSSEVPRQGEDGLFDCSVPQFTTFRVHLQCNLVLECRGELN